MSDFTLLLIGALGCISLCLSGLCLFALIKVRKELHSLSTVSDKEIRMTRSTVLGIGNRVLELESRLAHLRKDQQTLSDTQQDFAYNKAKSLLEQGLSREAVSASTGLSLSEVDLIQLVHSQNNTLTDPVP